MSTVTRVPSSRVNVSRMIGEHAAAEIASLNSELTALEDRKQALLTKRAELEKYAKVFAEFNGPIGTVFVGVGQ